MSRYSRGDWADALSRRDAVLFEYAERGRNTRAFWPPVEYGPAALADSSKLLPKLTSPVEVI